MILGPPKLYLDTSHIVNIARMRAGRDVRCKTAYQRIDEYITKWHFGLVYSAPSPLEWVDGLATEESARELARVFDSARLVYHFSAEPFVYLAEILSECRRIKPILQIPYVPILQPVAPNLSILIPLAKLLHDVPSYLDADERTPSLDPSHSETTIKLPSFEAVVRRTWSWKTHNESIHRERVVGFTETLLADISAKDEIPKNLGSLQIDWVKRFLRVDRVISHLNPGEDVEALLSAVDIGRCPAVTLWFRARLSRVKDGRRPEENDVDDWATLPVAPYVDLMLTEKSLRHFLHQAGTPEMNRITSNPDEAVAILESLGRS